MNYGNKLSQLMNEGIKEIQSLIQTSSDFSDHVSTTQCLKIIDDEFMLNLEGGRYLTEITSEELIDNSGYQYNYSVLETEQLLKLFDYLIETYK